MLLKCDCSCWQNIMFPNAGDKNGKWNLNEMEKVTFDNITASFCFVKL